MPEPIGSPGLAATAWALLPAPPASAWTDAQRIPIVVGPVYFLYGGASVWTLVR
jgi:hypothetical protein